jgi:hypothetical protein
MIDKEKFRQEVQPKQPALFELLRIVWVLSPFLAKVLVGFEWAVLLAIGVAAHQICAVLRSVLIDTTALNLMKQHEHKLWDAGD